MSSLKEEISAEIRCLVAQSQTELVQVLKPVHKENIREVLETPNCVTQNKIYSQ